MAGDGDDIGFNRDGPSTAVSCGTDERDVDRATRAGRESLEETGFTGCLIDGTLHPEGSAEDSMVERNREECDVGECQF